MKIENNIENIQTKDIVNQKKAVNSKARYVLKSVVGENEKQDTVVVKNDQMLFMKNKRTGKGVLMHFD